MEYKLVAANYDQLEDVYKIIDERINWMDEVGIKQWNVTKYWERYPKSYYVDRVNNQELFVLVKGAEVCAVVVLYKSDDRWPETTVGSAYYLHHFATSLKHKSTGSILLKLAEEKCKEDGMEYIRFDSADDNEKLANYYESKGYPVVGKCVDGLYSGNLREKRLVNE